MSNFKAKDKKIIPEFIGSLMNAIARSRAKTAVKNLEKNPVIKKHISKIKQIDREMKADIESRLKTDPQFKKDYKAALDFIDSI
jgi:ribosomal protein S20|tara:strand:- start:234 stop:485 length:252 start_codon:yes stop_codon:yes gene_type:complete